MKIGPHKLWWFNNILYQYEWTLQNTIAIRYILLCKYSILIKEKYIKDILDFIKDTHDVKSIMTKVIYLYLY